MEYIKMLLYFSFIFYWCLPTLLHSTPALHYDVGRTSANWKVHTNPPCSCEAFIGTYATDAFIAKTNRDITFFAQASNNSPREYLEALWKLAPWCEGVYDKYVLN